MAIPWQRDIPDKSQPGGSAMSALRRLVVISALFLLAAGGAAAQVTVLQHAVLIDGTGAPPQRDMAILLENGHVAAIQPSARLTVPAGAVTRDLAGRYVVPGIINAHGHVGPGPRDQQLRQYAL